MTLRLERFAVKVPFGDPRDMGVEGSILIFGADSSPLHAVLGSGIRLSAGLSADLIYFEVEGPGEPIEIPPIGRYRDGAVRIGTLRLGYGYTSNSFNFVVDGGITLPPALVEDADTSRSIGAGIRLPSVTNLYFRLGVIPLPGPIPVVPIVDFNLDMRRPNLPGLRSSDGCVPEWDGLQLIVPDVIRADVKHLAFGILFSGLPIVHHRFDGDLVLGTETDGVSYIVDDYLSLNSLGSYQIPLLVSSSTPFFENICVNLRIAGFAINFDIQHPFPEFSPRILLEVLALLSSETFELDPDGEIANIVRVAARDVSLAVPDWAGVLFPRLAAVLPKDAGVVFNIADLVPAVQAVIGAVRTAVEVTSSTAADIETALTQLLQSGELLDPNVLLGSLPASYRKFRSSASLVGFQARCVILLLAPSEAAAEFGRRGQPAAVPTSGLPRPAVARRGERLHDSTENLFDGREFASFTAADFAALGTLPERSAIVVAARVKVFASQRYRFIGYLASSGEFTLVSAATLDPLWLRVLGVDAPIPLEMAGRLRLHGRTLRDGGYAAVAGSGWARWRLIPNVLEAELGTPKRPLEISLESNGRFRLAGNADVRLGSASISGDVEVSHAHALVRDATLTYRTSVVGLLVEGDGRLGPGAKLEFRGSGALTLFGQPVAAVDLALSDTRAELSARIDSRNVLPDLFDARISGDIAGWLSLTPANRTRFRLAGTGEVSIHDATIRGQIEIGSEGKTRIDVHAQGALVWMGHEWLSGFATFSQFEYAIGGRTSIVMPLTYGSGQVPRIIAQLDLGATLRMNKQNDRFEWQADAGMSVGLKLANGQFVPMISNVVSGGGCATASLRLISLAQFSLLPGFEDVELLVPDVRSDGYMDVVGVVDVSMPIDMRQVDAVPDAAARPPGEVPITIFPLFSVHGIKTVTLQQLSFMALPIAIDLKFANGRLVLDVSYGGNRFDVDLVRV